MSSDSASAYLHTRLSLHAQRLLPFARLAALVADEIEQVIAVINRVHATRERHLQADGSGVGRFLSQRMFDDFQLLLRPLTATDYRFLKQAIRWFELVNLKVLIRGKFTGVTEAELTEQLVELGSFADLPLQRLIETDDPYEMLRLLEQTTYGGIVRQARRVYEEQGHDLFSLDSAIDRNFFIALAGRARLLATQDQLLLRPVFGTLMDRFNLLWLLRYRFSYGLSPARSYYLLTATGQQLHAPELMQLARLESLADVIEALPPRLGAVLHACRDIFEVEQVMELYSLQAARRVLAHSRSAIVRAFAYLLLREAETRYLIAIVKGKRLGFDSELIAQAVGGIH